MKVQFVGAGGKNYSLVVNDLFGAIIPEQSHIKVGLCINHALSLLERQRLIQDLLGD